MPVSTASPIEFGVSVQALPLQGINPARKEDQLNRADCREGLLIFEAANWLEKDVMPFEAGVAPVPRVASYKKNQTRNTKESGKGCVCRQPQTRELPRAGITKH